MAQTGASAMSIVELRRLFNENCRGLRSCPLYIVLGPEDYAMWDLEMDLHLESLPIHLRFITRQPMFKGAFVFGYGVDGVVEFAHAS